MILVPERKEGRKEGREYASKLGRFSRRRAVGWGMPGEGTWRRRRAVRGECSGSTISLRDPTWRVGMMRTVRGEEGGWLVGW